MPKIRNLEEMLLKFPEDQREDMRKQITEMFEGMDTSKPIGTPVESLPEGQKNCPHCNGPLVDVHGKESRGVPLPNGSVVNIVDCKKCDVSFTVPAIN